MLRSGEKQVLSELPAEIFAIYSRLEQVFSKQSRWEEMEEGQIWHELCLCILSSNVPYELARSSLAHLVKTELVESDTLLSNRKAKTIIARELARPIYLPRKKDGTFRKYRFPRVRAHNIVDAAHVLYSSGNGIQSMLESSEEHEWVRNNLAEKVPGIGLKESSHFLRNIGYSSNLAIIDAHIVSFLKHLKILPDDYGSITSKNYFVLEDLMQQMSKEYSLNLAILDNAIWHYMRSISRL